MADLALKSYLGLIKLISMSIEDAVEHILEKMSESDLKLDTMSLLKLNILRFCHQIVIITDV